MQTIRTIVLNAFVENRGCYLSVSDLRKEIFENSNVSMKLETIVKTIDELRKLYHRIDERTERRGKFKLPVKVFRLETIFNNENEK